MPTKRLTMRRIHRLMTMHFGAGAGTRVIARELGISHSTVREYLARIAAAGITWPLPRTSISSSTVTLAPQRNKIIVDRFIYQMSKL